MSLRFSVVIPTFNRSSLVGRAIQSVLDQQWADMEIIVVDDASTEQGVRQVVAGFPGVRYIRQDCNMGPSVARNRGLMEARNPWVIMLDDDDELLPGAMTLISDAIERYGNYESFAVFQFAHTNGVLAQDVLLIRLGDYLSGTIKGDFVPVINKRRFVEKGYSYPANKAGAEHLLWWRVAQSDGIPSFGHQVARVNEDAPNRLTSVDSQLRNARDLALAQDETLELFGEILLCRSPNIYTQKCLGSATYWLLAGERTRARQRLRTERWGSFLPVALGLYALSFLPLTFTKSLYKLVRRSKPRRNLGRREVSSC